MQLLTISQQIPSQSSSQQPAALPSELSLVLLFSIAAIWYGMSLWPAWVSSPGSDPSRLLVPSSLLAGRAV